MNNWGSHLFSNCKSGHGFFRDQFVNILNPSHMRSKGGVNQASNRFLQSLWEGALDWVGKLWLEQPVFLGSVAQKRWDLFDPTSSSGESTSPSPMMGNGPIESRSWGEGYRFPV